MSEAMMVEVSAGEARELRSRYGQKRTVRVGREWSVRIDGEEVGRIRYDMIRRERRTRRSGVVDSGWHSPGWEYSIKGYWFEVRTKREALESILTRAG